MAQQGRWLTDDQLLEISTGDLNDHLRLHNITGVMKEEMKAKRRTLKNRFVG